jgi:hypothetical protein
MMNGRELERFVPMRQIDSGTWASDFSESMQHILERVVLVAELHQVYAFVLWRNGFCVAFPTEKTRGDRVNGPFRKAYYHCDGKQYEIALFWSKYHKVLMQHRVLDDPFNNVDAFDSEHDLI